MEMSYEALHNVGQTRVLPLGVDYDGVFRDIVDVKILHGRRFGLAGIHTCAQILGVSFLWRALGVMVILREVAGWRYKAWSKLMRGRNVHLATKSAYLSPENSINQIEGMDGRCHRMPMYTCLVTSRKSSLRNFSFATEQVRRKWG